MATVVDLVPLASAAPVVPPGIEGRGADLWISIWGGAPWLSAVLDNETVRVHVESLLERDSMRATIAEHGHTLSEPISTARGDVVGQRLVAHPLIPHLRRLEAQIAATGEKLGLSPGSRSRIGVSELELRERASRLTNAKTVWRRPT